MGFPRQSVVVLDAMSGMGETWSELLRRFPDAELAALDFSPRMIEHASTRNESRFGGRFAAELARILRPGGWFAFIEVTEPPNPVLRTLYDFYLSKIVPLVGLLLVFDPVEYRMLFRYLREYGRGERSAKAFVAHPPDIPAPKTGRTPQNR